MQVQWDEAHREALKEERSDGHRLAVDATGRVLV